MLAESPVRVRLEIICKRGLLAENIRYAMQTVVSSYRKADISLIGMAWIERAKEVTVEMRSCNLPFSSLRWGSSNIHDGVE